MTSDHESLVSYLERAMQHRGLNKRQLANYVGVHHSTAGRWFSGDDIPSPTSCRKIAAYLRVPEDYVLELSGHRKARGQAPLEMVDPLVQLTMEAVKVLTQDERATVEAFIRFVLAGKARETKPMPTPILPELRKRQRA